MVYICMKAGLILRWGDERQLFRQSEVTRNVYILHFVHQVVPSVLVAFSENRECVCIN